jgi:predicted nucleic acid-binding protein
MALEVALETGCTAYDGFYVALAMASGCPLVTADEALVRLFALGRHRRHLCWVEDIPRLATPS